MSTEICQICKEPSTPWLYVKGNICGSCATPDKWISVNDRLPKHHQVVLIYKDVPTKTGFLVAYFIDSIRMNEELSKTPITNECVNIKENPYYFASREQQGFTVKDVTHWMPLPQPPTELEEN